VMLTSQHSPTLSPQQMEDLAQRYAKDGYLVFPGVVSAARLAQHRDELLNEFARAKRAGELFSGGGTISGHLNCFPGAQSRFVYETLTDYGIIDLIRKISPQAVRAPNVGCNLNLPGSSPQNYHIDGYASTPFMIANVAAVDTTLLNGAMEASPGTHLHDYKYWEFVLARHPGKRFEMKAGDVVIRPSSLWHRGMPNMSKEIRPMLAFSWEDGGSKLDDHYAQNSGKIAFLTNRYTLDFAGKMRERAFAALPALGASYLFVRSMLSD
jgi:hypothetical protein